MHTGTHTEADTGAHRRIRVAIADDTPDMRLLLRSVMTHRPDIEVVGEAANGLEAIDLVAALRPDLLVLDLDMPVLDGLGALPRLKVAAPETRVVILSAFPASLHGNAALDAGAAAYVQKSTPIAAVVDEVLRGADLLDVVLTTLAASAHLALTRETSSPAEARRFVATTLHSWAETRLVETVQLLMTELVTNVIVHTAATPDVRVSLLPDHVHIEVIDADPSPATPRHASPDADSGRGLQLVNALASAWGTAPLAHGKVVWFDVAR